jgi:HAD superfamily hydrolase (TIGR01549 family)
VAPLTVKAIIFDLDGTLVDSNIDFQKMKNRSIPFLESSGVKQGILSEKMTNYDIKKHSTKYLKRVGVQDSETKYLFQEVAKIINKIELEALETVQLIKDVEETLKELRRRQYKLGIVTRGCRDYVDAILKRLDLEKFFDAILARDDVENPKPDPEHPQKLMELLKVKPFETLLVGDRPIDDGNCAQNAGVKFVWFNKLRVKNSSTIKPDYEIESFIELLSILTK